MSKILIIDDDVELTGLLDEFLSDFNFNVSIKHSPIEGLEFLNKNKIDIILLDMKIF